MFADFVKETTSSTGLGSYILAGVTSAQFQTFATAGLNGETVKYLATDGSDSEVGEGVFTTGPATLTRATIEASTNGGAAVDWAVSPVVGVNAPASFFNSTRVLQENIITSSTATVEFLNLDGRAYEIIYSRVDLSTSADLVVEVSTDNGSTWATTLYLSSGAFTRSAASDGTRTSTTNVIIGAALSTTGGAGGSVSFGSLDSATRKNFFGLCSCFDGTTSNVSYRYGGVYNSTTAVDAVRIRPDSGTIDLGLFQLLDVAT